VGAGESDRAVELANQQASRLAAHGRLKEAEAVFRAALERAPHSAVLHTNLGNALRAQNRLDEAMACHHRAIELSPNAPQPYHNLANVLRQKNDLLHAAAAGRKALELAPDNPAICSNLSDTLLSLGHADEAIALARRALAFGPNFPEAYFCLGAALIAKGDLEEGAAKLRRVAELRPGNAVVRHSLGRVLIALGDCRGAIEHLNVATQRQPQFHEAQFALAVALLSEGQFTEGWRHYEARLAHPEHISRIRLFSKPRWRGQSFIGKTLLLHAEQGLGDTIQMIRYLPLVVARGGSILLELQPELFRLIEANLGQLPVSLVGRGQSLPPYDFNCPLMSLPLVFETGPKSIPGTVPYLSARPIVAPSRLRRVGLAWAAAAGSANGKVKSIHLADFAPLARESGVEFISLQKGAREVEARQPPAGMALACPFLEDFLDTARVISGLDLVITVDTSVAHLAGAMGKPVWILLPLAADWRWLTRRGDSPWYATARLFRQSRRGDWSQPLQRVVSAFRESLRPGV
jgi:tetratricopeptide (TPR) repeat protein